MRAIVVAAGRGSRLAPLTDALPKPLLPVLNRPVIEHVLLWLGQAGITDIGVTVAPHAAGPIRRYFDDDGARLGLRITWLEDDDVIGTGASLRDHAAFLDGQPALVATADMLTDVDPAAVMAHHQLNPATVTVAVHPVDIAAWPGDVVHADGVRGLAYQFKPTAREALSHLGSTGIWVIEPPILEGLPGGFLDFSSDVLPGLPSERHRLGVYNAGPTRLRDFGQFDTYLQGNLEALAGSYDASSAGGATSTRVWVEAGVDVHRSAHLTGPVSLGRGSVLGPEARIVGPAVVGPGAHIEAGACVVRSVVLPGAVVSSGSLLAHAVAGHPVRVLDHLLAGRGPSDRCAAPQAWWSARRPREGVHSVRAPSA